MNQQLIAHGQDIEYPQAEYQMFAMVDINGTQYKVIKDEQIVVQKLDFPVGKRLELDQILLIGTKDYTSVGRPFVESARVLATVEE